MLLDAITIPVNLELSAKSKALLAFLRTLDAEPGPAEPATEPTATATADTITPPAMSPSLSIRMRIWMAGASLVAASLFAILGR